MVIIIIIIIIISQKVNISAFVKQAYFAYFKVNLGDQHKPWDPRKVCKQCVESLRMWTKEHLKSLHSISPWFGESKRIISQTVAFV